MSHPPPGPATQPGDAPLLNFSNCHAGILAHLRAFDELPALLCRDQEERHRAMLGDVHLGLTRQGDRLGGQLTESSERLRAAVAQELASTRDRVHALMRAGEIYPRAAQP